MGLKNKLGDTAFRDLKFGNDRLGGGDSGLPYIQSKIIDNESELNFYRFNPDFPMRGGLLAGLHSGIDLQRFGKFLADPVKGPLFITKQVGLQLQNPKIEMGKQIGLEQSRIYNLGANTMLQIGLNAFGSHFNRHGLLPSTEEDQKYGTFVVNRDAQDRYLNRLVLLSYTKRLGTTSRNDDARKLGIDIDNENILISYNGGPDSYLGIGKTVINKAKKHHFQQNSNGENLIFTNVEGRKEMSGSFADNFKHKNEWLPLVSGSIKVGKEFTDYTSYSRFRGASNDTKNVEIEDDIIIDNNINLWSTNNLKKAELNLSQTAGGKGPQDFRQVFSGSIPSFDYRDKKINQETRVLTGNPGKRGAKRIKYSDGVLDENNKKDISTKDKINLLPLYKSTEVLGVDYTRDLVKFRFEVINNDNPTESTFVHFRAFFAGFNDTPKPEWNSYKYLGRGESFWTYNGFKRDIGFSFKIYPQSREEMKPLYQKLNYMISTCAPDYTDEGFMRGNIVKLTLGDYIYSQPGILQNFSVKSPPESTWEIAMVEPENPNGADSDMHELPHYLEVEVTWTPIHTFIPRLGANIPFITPSDLTQNAFLGTKAKNESNFVYNQGQFKDKQLPNFK